MVAPGGETLLPSQTPISQTFALGLALKGNSISKWHHPLINHALNVTRQVIVIIPFIIVLSWFSKAYASST